MSDHDNTIDNIKARLARCERELALVQEITELVRAESDLQKVFERVARHARELVNAKTVLIPILSEDCSTYTYRATDGEGASELLGEELPIGVGLCGWVLENQRPWWRGALETLTASERNIWESKAGTVVLVPLVGKKSYLGGIAAMNKQGEPEFSERDFELLNLFANQVSVAIESAMIIDQLERERTKAQELSNALEKANTDLVRSNDELQHLAVHDPLTGLPNRTLLLDRLEQGLKSARRDDVSLSLIMIDLDYFKEINDTLGHAIGDQLLCALGNRFREVLREVDTLGRLGGDEFAVVVPGASYSASLAIARKLQQSLQLPVSLGDISFSVSASVGIALYPIHGRCATDLLRSADVAMYMAKQLQDDCCVYDEDFDAAMPTQFELLSDLRKAVQNQEIEIALQPKLDLRSEEIVGAEALARWYHPDKGAIPPVDFVPILEKTGLIKEFTLSVLEKSLCACAQARARGFDISVAVNLSMHNLRDSRLPRQIDELLHGYDVPADKLILEITESAIMNDPERTIEVLCRLDEMGLRLSVDDFGTGYSSLTYLKKLPVQQLKIDRSFVHEIETDPDDAVIVRSTAELAVNLGLNVVAEGVETEKELEIIRAMGIDMVQGYLVSRPLSPEDFFEFLARHPSGTRAFAQAR